jgi:MYXO-CTERM domain-containing protein
MTKFAAFALLLIGTAGIAGAVPVPEIDPASGGSALALLAGALLVVRSRRKS